MNSPARLFSLFFSRSGLQSLDDSLPCQRRCRITRNVHAQPVIVRVQRVCWVGLCGQGLAGVARVV